MVLGGRLLLFHHSLLAIDDAEIENIAPLLVSDKPDIVIATPVRALSFLHTKVAYHKVSLSVLYS